MIAWGFSGLQSSETIISLICWTALPIASSSNLIVGWNNNADQRPCELVFIGIILSHRVLASNLASVGEQGSSAQRAIAVPYGGKPPAGLSHREVPLPLSDCRGDGRWGLWALCITHALECQLSQENVGLQVRCNAQVSIASLGRNPFQNPRFISYPIYCCLYIVEVYSNIVPPILGITGIIKPYLSKSSRMLTHPATNDSQKTPTIPIYNSIRFQFQLLIIRLIVRLVRLPGSWGQGGTKIL